MSVFPISSKKRIVRRERQDSNSRPPRDRHRHSSWTKDALFIQVASARLDWNYRANCGQCSAAVSCVTRSTRDALNCVRPQGVVFRALFSESCPPCPQATAPGRCLTITERDTSRRLNCCEHSACYRKVMTDSVSCNRMKTKALHESPVAQR